tara:strand:+ start:183 stop:410 length:228 start_codon:yes stop_codon:yes gene_type:complete
LIAISCNHNNLTLFYLFCYHLRANFFFFDEEDASCAKVAQLVEQRTENPCVGSSILPLGIFAGVAQWLEQLIRNQ